MENHKFVLKERREHYTTLLRSLEEVWKEYEDIRERYNHFWLPDLSQPFEEAMCRVEKILGILENEEI